MNQSFFFGKAEWLCAQKESEGIPPLSVLRGHFTVNRVKKAVLSVLGLGFFRCYLNGEEITKDRFLPLSTDYEPRENHPAGERLTGHRIYVPQYDVTEFLREGENVLALHFGGGWYTFDGESYGDPKAIYRLVVETEDGTTEFCSSTKDKIGASFVRDYYFTQYEQQDYTAFDEKALTADFDDRLWSFAQRAKPLQTEYLVSDCPADREGKLKPVRCITKADGGTYYDTGSNCSALPVFRITAKKGETVTVLFSEECAPDGTLDMNFHHGQRFSLVSDGKERTVQPMFTWFAFRYFAVFGAAEPMGIREVHSDVRVSSEFQCDRETLNWLYQTYVSTQLSNLHTGIPSDCPHLERRGYTGDGQLTCHAAMDMLDAKAFYRKWMEDISDCQDVCSGHVQYTAPYTRCGGGPGGWGCAIIEVPYQYYRHYGDKEPLDRYYAQMKRYLDYLEAHSVNQLVASDKEGEWCLGDWCAPNSVVLPAAFVNNYFYIKSLGRMIEIAGLIGKECDIPEFGRQICIKKEAVKAAYFNTWDGNFIGCLQGANAIAVDMGLGDERTYCNLVQYYNELGRYDTGIFGTEIVTRVLFEHGDGELAVRLLLSEEKISFEGMRRAGATSLWEYWPGTVKERSHNHPMFGAAAACLFDYLLGIRQKENTAGYSELVIAPELVNTLEWVRGKRTLPLGEVSVSYVKQDGFADFVIRLPEQVSAHFSCGSCREFLHGGENRVRVALSEK